MRKQDKPWSKVNGHPLLIHASDATLADQLRQVAIDESIWTGESIAADNQAWQEVLRRHRAQGLSEDALNILREIRLNLRRKGKWMHPSYATWLVRLDWLLADVVKRAQT